MNLKTRKTFQEIVPYSTQIADGIVLTKNKQYLASWELDGISFECEEELELNVLNSQTHNFLKTIASDQVHFYHHIIRSSICDSFNNHTNNYFADKVSKLYYEGLEAQTLRKNRIYFTIVYGTSTKTSTSINKKTSKLVSSNAQALEQDLRAMNELIEKVGNFFRRLGGKHLKTYKNKESVICSAQLEFYNFLISGEWVAMPIIESQISNMLGTSDVYFKGEMCELHGRKERKYCRSIEIKEMPSTTSQNSFDALLVSDCDFVITQSFSPLPKRKAISLLNLSAKRLRGANDDAKSQQDDLTKAKDCVASGDIFLGQYHFSAMIFGSSIESVLQKSNNFLNVMSDIGFVALFAKFSLIASFCAQLPCVFDLRPRLMPLNSKNYVDLATFHNFKSGKRDKNCWGEAICLLKTTNKGAYYLNLHDANTRKDEFGDKNLANTSIIGASGAGKTMLLSFLQIMMQKYGIRESFNESSNNKRLTTIFLDKDRGAELNIRALGGEYYIFKSGHPTGWNPFKLDATESNRAFLKELIKLLTSESGKAHSSRELNAISNSVDSVLSLKPQDRSYGITRCLESLNKATDKEAKEKDLSIRLFRWSQEGEYGWIFDNADDSFNIEHHSNFGFDGTEFLDKADISAPISFYILHRISGILDGRRGVIFMDEFWKWMSDEVFADFAYNKLKTIRKLNGMLIAATQSPDEILKSNISRAVVESCSTQIFLANPKASKADYVDGFKVSAKEYEIIKGLDPNSRTFLIKKSSLLGDSKPFSAVVKLDLSGLKCHTKILSSNSDNLDIFQELYKQGLEPQSWIEKYLQLAI